MVSMGYIPKWTDFLIKKFKDISPWAYVVEGLNGEEMNRNFYEQELKKTKQTVLDLKKCCREKVINSMLNGKVMMIHSIVDIL